MQEELANEAIRNTLGKLPISHYLADFPHHIPPCHNLHKNLKLDDEEAVADATHFFKPFPYLCSSPVPISQATKLPRKVLNGIDPATALIREKMKWEKKKKTILKANRKDKKHINHKLLSTALCTNGDTTLLPRGVAMLAEHLQADPDPRFAGSYNWYYSGGNLKIFSHLDETYLVSSNALTPEILSLARLTETENVLKKMNFEPFTLNVDEDRNSPVFEIVTEKEIVAARQKTRVHIMKASEEDGQMKLNTVHSVQSKHTLNEGFVSVALANHSEGEYCVLSNCGVLRLYQLEKSEKCVCSVKIQTGEGVLTCDRWGSVHYSEPNILLFTDRCCVHLLDHRCGLEETQLAWCPKNLCEHCEEISVCIPSSVNNHVQYVGTNHQALSLDIRSGFTQRWTHMMHNTPYIGFTTTLTDSCEMLVLGGQSQTSVCSIINTWEDDVGKSYNIPFTLTSPTESLQSVRCRGHCLEPTLLSRYDFSLTGLAYLKRQRGLIVLRSSSVGDIFCQELQDKRSAIANTCPSVAECFGKWDVSDEVEPVRVSATQDFGDMFETINKWNSSPLSWSQSKLSIYEPSEEDWRVSKSYLEECVDMLAAPLLSVWEVGDEPEWECSKETTVEEQDPADKVLNWLGNNTGPKPQDSANLTGPLLPIEVNNETTRVDLFDTTNLNSYSLSQLTAPRIPSPSPSKRTLRSNTSARSLKEVTLSQTAAEHDLENSQRPTPRKKFVSGF